MSKSCVKNGLNRDLQLRLDKIVVFCHHHYYILYIKNNGLKYNLVFCFQNVLQKFTWATNVANVYKTVKICVKNIRQIVKWEILWKFAA